MTENMWAIDVSKDYEEGNGAWLSWFIQWQMLDSRRRGMLEISIYLFIPQSPAAKTTVVTAFTHTEQLRNANLWLKKKSWLFC